MEMKDTVEIVNTPEYINGLKEEYSQTKTRYEKLRKAVVRADAGTVKLRFIEILREQARIMSEYLYILEVRAEAEKIEL